MHPSLCHRPGQTGTEATHTIPSSIDATAESPSTTYRTATTEYMQHMYHNPEEGIWYLQFSYWSASKVNMKCDFVPKSDVTTWGVDASHAEIFRQPEIPLHKIDQQGSCGNQIPLSLYQQTRDSTPHATECRYIRKKSNSCTRQWGEKNKKQKDHEIMGPVGRCVYIRCIASRSGASAKS